MAIRKQNEQIAYLRNEEGVTVQGISANFFGASTDSKPTTNIVNGSFFMEVDTGKIFAFNETTSSWVEIQ